MNLLMWYLAGAIARWAIRLLPSAGFHDQDRFLASFIQIFLQLNPGLYGHGSGLHSHR
jgi:hypothetical protein